MWPKASPVTCFQERRRRFLESWTGAAVFGSGIARVRNFEDNRFAFRAESHFLYFVGQHIEEALLVFDEGKATLYVRPPDPEDALWHGPEPTLQQRAEQLGLDVAPIVEFDPPADVATLPPADVESSLWLEELLGRAVEAGNLAAVEADLALAECVLDLRLQHDEHAIEQMRQAVRVTVAAHHAGMAVTRPGLREAEVRAAIEREFTRAGMSPAYQSIVTVQGEVLHHQLSLNLMQAGDLILADAGAESVEGWASDVTRTWPVSGSFSPTQADAYDAVLQAQRAAIDACRPGVRYLEVHRAASRTLTQALLDCRLLKGSIDELLERGAAALFFPHGIGHLLGLDVHDMEDLGDLAGYAPGRSRSTAPQERYLRLDRDLAPGMVVTIEPGFYLSEQALSGPEFHELRDLIDERRLEQFRDVRGIRIEDDVLITNSGHEVLSEAIAKERRDVEAAVMSASGA